MKNLALRFQKIARRFGFDLVPLSDPNAIGLDPFRDMSRFLGGDAKPLVFDVGANVGQSVAKFKKTFPGCSIHAFEPGSSTFHQLRERSADFSDVHLWNLGVGSSEGKLVLQENEHSTMSSFLEPSKFCWGGVVNRNEVEVVTLDGFAQKHGIEKVHILKSDTQGFDVLAGAAGLLNVSRIHAILAECSLYPDDHSHGSFEKIHRQLASHGFYFIAFHGQFNRVDNHQFVYADALFVHRDAIRLTGKKAVMPVDHVGMK